MVRKLIVPTLFALVMATTLAPSAKAASPSIVPLSAGVFHTCALTAGGGVQCWGAGGDGALGNGSNANSNVPVDVTGLLSGVSAISAGWYHTCALTTSGGVKCWGANGDGQLGNGTSFSSNVPVDVSGLSSGVVAISGGGFHTCALMTSGDLKCWGANGYGQLGVGTNTPSNVPADVMGGVATVAAGYYHTCAVTTVARPMCWGYNFYGQLGDGTNINRNSPVDVVPSNNAVAITAGESHTCMLTTLGGVQCWGDNGYGQLGDGTFDDTTFPVFVAGLGSGVAAVSSHGIHTCALTTGGGVKCWGDDFDGQLGDAASTFTGTPVDVDGLSSGVAAIAAGYYHSCALLTDGSAKCWGRNSSGQLGNGTTTRSNVPVGVLGTFFSDFPGGPPNDDFADAEVLTTDNSDITGTVLAATRESGEPTNCPSFAGSVWYEWTPAHDGRAIVGAAPVGFCLELWEGNTLGTLTPVEAVPLFGGGMTFQAVAGTTYHIAVEGMPSGAFTSFTIHRGFIPAPANDDFADATVVTGSGTVGGTVLAATRETGEPATCASPGGSVWYDWTPGAGLASATTASSSLCVVVYEGSSVGTLTPVDTFPVLGGRLFRAVAGTTYHIAVEGSPVPGFGYDGTFTLSHNFIPADSAEAVVGAAGTVTTDSEGDGATPADPVETTVTTPNAGTVSITEIQASPLPSPFTVLDFVVDITAPPATAANPISITFTIDASALPAGITAANLQVFRNGVPVPACTGAPAAVPDPCVSSRATVGGDAVITILTSQASTWTFETGATLIVRHVVINDNGGARTCSDFSFQVNGGSATTVDADCETSMAVPAGTYTVTQPAVAGYTTTYSNCSNVVLANGDAATCTITNDDVQSAYAFSGFFSPVDNPPVLNVVKGGQAIPVKFSLGGNVGLDIFAVDYPKSQQITCDAAAPLDVVEETAAAGASSLSYDASTDRYVYVWKTSKAWAQTCRRLTIRLSDGTEHVVLFKFT